MFKCLSKYFTGFNLITLMKFICTILYRVLNFYTPQENVPISQQRESNIFFN